MMLSPAGSLHNVTGGGMLPSGVVNHQAMLRQQAQAQAQAHLLLLLRRAGVRVTGRSPESQSVKLIRRAPHVTDLIRTGLLGSEHRRLLTDPPKVSTPETLDIVISSQDLLASNVPRTSITAALAAS
jgi:hypothetical protein